MTTLARPALPGVLLLFSALAGCASGPPTPDWQMTAQSAIGRFESAYMDGNSAIEAAEWRQARTQIASTGKVDLLIRIELVRCATRVASLVFEPCAGFERLRADAAPADLAYANYLAASMRAGDAALLPEQHKNVAVAGDDTAAAAAAQRIADPLSALVAAGALLRAGRATPALLATAVDTASAQGWRRPLLAWLSVQATRAEQAGAAAEAGRIRRRIDLVQGTDAGAAPAN
ncbi:MAG: hypothetical protein V4754_10745 [Pseudomonadota bacterium]